VAALSRVELYRGAEAPFVLREERVLVDVGMRGGAGRAVTGKRLHVPLAGGAGRAGGVGGQAVEGVRAGEVAREEIQDAVELQIGAGAQLVGALDDGERIGELRAVDRRLARAEEVAADGQHRRSALANGRLRLLAVGEPRFLVARP